MLNSGHPDFSTTYLGLTKQKAGGGEIVCDLNALVDQALRIAWKRFTRD